MPRKILKKSLGEGGAFLDRSNGGSGGKAPSLWAVLKELVENPPTEVLASQATIAGGVLVSKLVTKDTVLRRFDLYAAVAGTAGATTVQVRVGGVAVAALTLTIDNAEADGAKKSVDLGANAVDVPAGSIIDIFVSAAPTGGTGLLAQLLIGGIDIEP